MSGRHPAQQRGEGASISVTIFALELCLQDREAEFLVRTLSLATRHISWGLKNSRSGLVTVRNNTMPRWESVSLLLVPNDGLLQTCGKTEILRAFPGRELEQTRNKTRTREPGSSLQLCPLLPFDVKEEFRAIMRDQLRSGHCCWPRCSLLSPLSPCSGCQGWCAGRAAPSRRQLGAIPAPCSCYHCSSPSHSVIWAAE